MKRLSPNSLNQKLQNGTKNPIPGKEFTPNGAAWIGYSSDSTFRIYDIPIKLCL